MKTNLDHLLEFFPIGTAEGERHLLARAYVKNDAFGDLVAPAAGSPRLLVGKKGTGKTAVIQYASEVLAASKIPYLSLKPMDLDLEGIRNDAAIATITRAAYSTILQTISAKLGEQTSGLIDAGDKLLYEAAIKTGKKKRDIIGEAARLLPKIAKPIIKVDLTSIFPETIATANELRSAIAASLRKYEKSFYMFVDDTDQIASPAVPDHLNRIWGFILAAREVTQRIAAVRIVITLREEVWRRLIRDRAGQRDQADHFLPLVRELAPNQDHVRAIVNKRLALAAAACSEKYTYSAYEIFFEGQVARMPLTEEKRSWEDLIILRSRERPRDAIQLISALVKRAQRRESHKIEETDFHKEMPEFSAQRVFFLAQEVDVECPQIREVVESFAKLKYDYGSFKVTAEALRDHLCTIPTIFSTTLFGKILKPDNDEDAFELWRFLFEIGVVNARVADDRKKDGFRHISPREDPGLISNARWGDIQGMVWEINPAYRDFLISRQEAEAHRSGLPPKRPKRRRR